MTWPRSRLVDLMVAVGFVALDLAGGRFLFEHDPDLLIGVIPSGLALQAGVVRLLRGRGRQRAFWVGFLLVGGLMTASFVAALLDPETIGVEPFTGRLFVQPGSRLYGIWSGYATWFVRSVVGSLIGESWVAPGSMAASISTAALRALTWSIPQLGGAVGGGLVAILIVRRGPRR